MLKQKILYKNVKKKSLCFFFCSQDDWWSSSDPGGTYFSIAHAFALFVAVSVGANISWGHVNPTLKIVITFFFFLFSLQRSNKKCQCWWWVQKIRLELLVENVNHVLQSSKKKKKNERNMHLMVHPRTLQCPLAQLWFTWHGIATGCTGLARF